MRFLVILVILFQSICFGMNFDKKYDDVTLDDKIGQMIIVGFIGNTTNSKDFKKILKEVEDGSVSGVILFSNNIKSKEELIKMTNKIKKANKITPFIAIDNEGGEVQRYDFVKHKSAKEISEMSFESAKEEFASMAQLEKELGINYNFAPCVDLDINKNSIISKKNRSYSNNPKTAAKYARLFIQEHNKRHIITSIKHFPGHGSVDKDTHKEFADSTFTFKKEEILPYYLLNDLNKENTVMVSHIYNAQFDTLYPASLSKKIVKGLLINSIGFKGVIVSDDYDMKAIRDNYSLRDIVVNSINAGVNILLFSNHMMNEDKDLTYKIHEIVKNELSKGNIDIKDINNSWEKILKLKGNLN